MNNFSSEVKQKLDSIIQDMSDHHWLFTQNPGVTCPGSILENFPSLISFV